MKHMFNKNSVVWSLLIVTIIVAITDLVILLLNHEPIGIITALKYTLPVVLLFLHAIWTLTFSRGITFIVVAALTGLIFEIVGVSYGTIFGGEYVYSTEYLGPLIFDVPILVTLFWAVFIYIGYTITSSFLAWSKIEKPSIKNKSFGTLLLLVLIDALLVVAIDIFLDPILVHEGAWTWINGGAYFGVPIGNFVGWFLVTLISTGIFRTIEFLFPQGKSALSQETLLVSIIAYGTICGTFFLTALHKQMPELALIGVFVMLPVVLVNLLFFVNRKPVTN